MEDILNIGSVPEASFLDLLTALAVMPLAAFTTLACLGGGSGTPPEWMRLGDEVEIKTPEEEGDGGAIVSIGRTVGTVAGAAVGIGIGVAAAAASGVASKAQSAGSSAVAAANATPQGINSGMDAVSATEDAFSFVDSEPKYAETTIILNKHKMKRILNSKDSGQCLIDYSSSSEDIIALPSVTIKRIKPIIQPSLLGRPKSGLGSFSNTLPHDLHLTDVTSHRLSKRTACII